jgi:DNA-binding response OmpR family regulator
MLADQTGYMRMLHQRFSDRWLLDSREFHHGFPSSPRILVVEHNGYVARLIAYQLERVGYEVLVCGCACEAQEMIEYVGLPHGAVLDLYPSDQAGEALCQWLNAFSDIPTVVLLPADVSEVRLQSIRAYADAWLRKPFEPGHLARHVQWLMHDLGDSKLPLAPLVQVDRAFTMDFVHQCILLCGHKIPLSPSETKLMHILMRRSSCVVSTAFLASRLDRTRGCNGSAEESVHTAIHSLQQKIAAIQPGVRYVRAVPPAGYMFAQPENGGSPRSMPSAQ